MNIVIINGSPHKKGTSALLMENFICGAEEKGHRVQVFDAAQEKVHPCIACDVCRSDSDGCVFKDSMETLNTMLLEADMVVFVTPLYYFGMSTQLKTVIDRFYANNAQLRASKKKAVVLATCGDTDTWTFDALKHHFEAMLTYLNWTLVGSVYALGMYVRKDIEASTFPQQAYELGRSL